MRADDLDGTRWALEYLTIGGVSHMVSGRRIPEIAFVDGQVSLDDGVNLADGTYRRIGEGFSIDFEPTTALPYPPKRLPEHALFDHLRQVSEAHVHGDFLHLRYGAERAELVYRYEADRAPA